MIEETTHFNEDLIKSYYEDIDEGYFIEVDDQDTEKLCDLHNHLPFLHERMKN